MLLGTSSRDGKHSTRAIVPTYPGIINLVKELLRFASFDLHSKGWLKKTETKHEKANSIFPTIRGRT